MKQSVKTVLAVVVGVPSALVLFEFVSLAATGKSPVQPIAVTAQTSPTAITGPAVVSPSTTTTPPAATTPASASDSILPPPPNGWSVAQYVTLMRNSAQAISAQNVSDPYGNLAVCITNAVMAVATPQQFSAQTFDHNALTAAMSACKADG